ncbi:SusC/RagA family TonB-linked outer membrane protein [Polaribacter cellanae]|uniref:SusC/RagA family TonB-linked outer membrane protein n=1 Tax=Polaribacter cellanae TaxID=2818493 RepID=A0A975CNY2_9FLAO|nr:SusC/RagA family TonB-linked outer membrane protein [Polaribacter cellanae]QTE22567.1 SusC/RagA family TonB-linked outer membrane protein [Polaribacter cellanae]
MKIVLKLKKIISFPLKFDLKMKLTTFLLIATLFQLHATVSHGQKVKVTLNLEKVTMEKVLNEIESQTDYKFFYNYDEINYKKIVSVNAKKELLSSVLKNLFTNSKITFEIVNKQIVLKSAEKNSIGKLQQKQITGVVKSSKGEPLVGVSVLIKGTRKGVSSDFDGNYKINVSKGKTLVFSSIGYKLKEVLVGDSNTLNVVLEEDKVALEEIVVTGYRKIKANEFAGASAKIKMEDAKIGGVSSVDKMLQGQVAGVQIETKSSVFGAAPKIRIRGNSSITGINEPLWVLDGVVLQTPLNIEPSALYSGSARSLLSSVMSGVNPEDIQDITILKDATATALYGTKAVNGVIVITTKRAKKGDKLKVNYNSVYTYRVKPSINNFDILDSHEETNIHEQLFRIYQAELLNYSARNEGAYTRLLNQRNRKEINQSQFLRGLRSIKSVNTDWFDVLFKNPASHQQQHSISISNGGEKSSGRLSLSYLKDPGYTLGENVSRYTINYSTKYYFNDKFSVEALIKHSNRKQRNPGSRVNPYNYALNTSRAMRPYDDNGNFEYYKKNYAPFNIIKEIENDYIDINSKDLNLQVQLDYKPKDNLSFKVLANRTTITSSIVSAATENSSYAQSFRTTNFNIINRNGRLYQDPNKPSNALPETTLPIGGFLDQTNAETVSTTFRAQADYTVFRNNLHKLNVFGGSEIIQSKSSETSFKGFGYIFESGTPIPNELALIKSIRDNDENYYNTAIFRRNQVSFYGSLIYTLKNRYNFTASLRNDATNVSGTSTRNRFLPTWVAAGAWTVTNEPFMENQDIFSNLKLRVSYGLRGNAGNRGPDLVAFYGLKSRIYPSYNELSIDIRQPEVSDLDFEKEHIFNAGLDASFLKYLNITFEYYHRKNFDLVGLKTVPLSLGYDSKLINWATMTNQGLELSLKVSPIKITDDLNVSGSFNIGYNKNEVVSNYFGDNPTTFRATRINGFPFQNKPLTGLYSYKFAGLDANGLAQYFDAKGNKIHGFNRSDKDYGNIEYQGSRDPLYSGGFSTSLNYKGLTLTGLFTFAAGNVVRKSDFYRRNNIQTLFRDDFNVPGDYKDRWQAPGNESYTNIPRLTDNTDATFYAGQGIFGTQYEAYNKSNIRTVDASYVRLRNVSLKYAFPKLLTDILKVDYLSMRLEATNVALFASKKLRGQDPETLLEGTNIPPVKSLSLAINLGF